MIKTQASCTDTTELGLLSAEQAKQFILETISPILEAEQIPIEKAKGRCLAENIKSPINVPAHTNSAVDGYALCGDDIPTQDNEQILTIQATVLAGQYYTTPCKTKHCIRIMTGAPIPKGLDTVIMQEHCERIQNTIRIDHRHSVGQNIRLAGEDIQAHTMVLQRGKQLNPADIGLLASLGISEIKVTRKLRIAIASTGNEIYPLSEQPSIAGLYDSNRYSLLAALDRPDIDLINLGIIKDHKNTLIAQFNHASDYADIIISSGGVSVGDADFTKVALQKSGHIHFWKIAIKPGRPLAFGKINQSLFFGLPGNPVAVFVSFYQFVLPALEKALNITNKPIAPLIKAKSLHSIRKKSGRTEIQRGILSQSESGEWQVTTTGKQGSGILSSISVANCFIVLPHEAESIAQGDWVEVQLFSSLF